MEQLPTIIGALVLAAVLWVVKGTSENATALRVLQAAIDTNIMPELQRLRSSGHEVRNLAQEAVANTGLLEQRTAQAEREIDMLWNGRERRTGERRAEPSP